MVESTDRTSVMIVFLRSIANTEPLSQVQQKLIIACHDDSSLSSEESNRRTASAFSASLSGSVAIIIRAAVKSPCIAASVAPLIVSTATSVLRLRARFTAGSGFDSETTFRILGPTEVETFSVAA